MFETINKIWESTKNITLDNVMFDPFLNFNISWVEYVFLVIILLSFILVLYYSASSSSSSNTGITTGGAKRKRH
jgi:hypothetical protein